MKLPSIIYLVFCLTACNSFGSGGESDKSKGKMLAEVGSRKLYETDVSNLLQAGSSPEDSIRILKGVVNNWVKDQLMILEAEKNLPKDINLEKMIDDYRSSLLLYNYETKLATELLDTLVTKEEKQQYYNQHSDEFILPEAIAKYRVVRFARTTKSLDNFYKDWKKGDLESITIFCNNQADYSDLDGDTWKTISQLETLLPKNFVSRSWYGENKEMRKKYKDDEYFIRIFRYASADKVPPFEYIEAKIEKVILNERKIKLLKQKKQQLFDKEFGSSKVKLYLEPEG
ncbi:MAG TPA: hypothetical protein PLQ57_09205 [Saprospiraceae bacterium]|nr:hypothetical protein [Saprospiraceae bacterium]HRG21197.1 hypothetical protein [Saprospiraceae bacterium]HRG65559.1 hypothetical protein [Saprospiraceae bacterium]